ncbi:hypothetical protein EV128_11339 [Rhizobium azibense]|nr:hypothetical protein EV128_11339 [Rhizobium azibense]
MEPTGIALTAKSRAYVLTRASRQSKMMRSLVGKASLAVAFDEALEHFLVVEWLR